MTGFADELFDESIGTSSKKWALLLLAAIAGAAVALWLTGRGRLQVPDAGPAQVEVSSAPGELSPTGTRPKTSRINAASARLSRTRAVTMLRDRVARVGGTAAESADRAL